MGFPFVTTKQILKKLGGDKIPGKVLTFDGNIVGKDFVNMWVRVSDERLDLSEVQKVTIHTYNGDFDFTEGFTVSSEDNSMSVLSAEETPLVAVSDAGTYFAYIGDETAYELYTSRVELPETIHPIDPKYLPGVCLPVVEIAPGGTSQPFEVDLSAEQVAVVREAAKNCVPIIVAFRLLGGEFVGSAVVSLTNFPGSDAYLGSATVGINGAYVWQVEVETGAEGEGASVYIAIPEST